MSQSKVVVYFQIQESLLKFICQSNVELKQILDQFTSDKLYMYLDIQFTQQLKFQSDLVSINFKPVNDVEDESEKKKRYTLNSLWEHLEHKQVQEIMIHITEQKHEKPNFEDLYQMRKDRGNVRHPYLTPYKLLDQQIEHNEKKTQNKTVLALWEGLVRTIMPVPIQIKFMQIYTLLADFSITNKDKAYILLIKKKGQTSIPADTIECYSLECSLKDQDSLYQIKFKTPRKLNYPQLEEGETFFYIIALKIDGLFVLVHQFRLIQMNDNKQ